MKKKVVYGSLVLAVILCFLIIFFMRFSEKNVLIETETNSLLVKEEYQDVGNWLSQCVNQQKPSFILPKEKTVQDYNTFYGNMSLIKLGRKEGDLRLIYEINTLIGKKSFLTWSEGDVFEGIERCFYYDYLCRSLDKDYYNVDIEKYTDNLLKKTYHSEGYFLSEEFENYISSMDEEERLTTRLSQTMQMLYLCRQYHKIKKVDKTQIIQWLEESSTKTKKTSDFYYIVYAQKYLNVCHKEYKELLQTMKPEKFDAMELFYYVCLCRDYDVGISKEDMKKFSGFVERQWKGCSINDLSELYYTLSIAELLNVKIPTGRAKEIMEALLLYRRKDRLFPEISTYILDNKQLLMYRDMKAYLGEKTDEEKLVTLLTKNLQEGDVVDMYSYVVLGKPEGKDKNLVKQECISQLRKCTLNDKNRLCYLLMTAKQLEIKDLEKYISEEILNYVEILTTTPNIDYQMLDLILLYGFAISGQIEKSKLFCENIARVNIYYDKDVVPITMYYKYKLLLYFDYPIDIRKAKKQVSAFRCKGGYKITQENEFQDLQITYMLLELSTEFARYEARSVTQKK